MGHYVQAFVGRKECLNRICSKYGKSKVVPLKHGYFLLPLIDELYDSIDEVVEGHTYPSDNKFKFLTPKITKTLLEFSDENGLIYFETEYFGGAGWQGAIAAKGGSVVYGPSRDKHSINKALRKIGVVRTLPDEYNTIGLGAFRDNEDWILQPTCGKKKQRNISIMISSNRKLVLLSIMVILLLYFPIRKGLNVFNNYSELDSKSATFSGNSTDILNSVILPTFDAPVVPKKNNIWCNSFQLAWNEMQGSVIKEPIKVTGANDLSQRLNNSKQTKNDIAESSYYAHAGKVSDGVIEEIRSDMKNRFPSVQMPEFNTSDALIAYSYLETYIKFKHPFRNNDKALTFTDSSGSTTPLKSFGVWEGFLRKYKPLCDQIEVLYCKLDEEHNVVEYALDLCKNTKPYQIVVSSIERKDSLKLTFDEIQMKIKDFHNHPQYKYLRKFDEVDILQVPEMYWDIVHHFSELEGKPLSNKSFQGMPISTAMQMISFRLDRSGVILKSESRFAVEAIPRMFILDKPFLVYLKKRDADYPYFVMWVDNAELLTNFDDN